jgi:hypothetical protein
MSRFSRRLPVYVLAISFLSATGATFANGQTPSAATGSTASSSASGPGAGSGSGGSASIEPQLMAYAALQELGGNICTDVTTANTENRGVLILDVPLGTQLTNFYAYTAQVNYLTAQFKKAAPGGGIKPFNDLSSYAAPIASLIGLLKNGVTFSAQTFQVSTAPLIQALVAKSDGCKKYIQLSSVTHLELAEIDVSKQLQDLDAEHTKAKLPSDSALEALYQTFLKWLATANTSGGSVLSDAISGDAIVQAVCGDSGCTEGFDTLQLTVDAAGGNVRQNNFFLLNFFYTPEPSFNSGVEVSWSLYGPKNNYLAGETLKRMYGYSKWHSKKFKWTTDPSGKDTLTTAQ